MRQWGMAKARRQADVAATIERKNHKELSLLKDFAVMIKPKNQDTVDWTKIYVHENEFLEVEKSIESTEESEDEVKQEEYEPETETSKGKPLPYAKHKVRIGKSFSVGRIAPIGEQGSTLFALSQVDEGNESFDEHIEKDAEYFKEQNEQELLPRLKKGIESKFLRTATLDPRQKRAEQQKEQIFAEK